MPKRKRSKQRAATEKRISALKRKIAQQNKTIRAGIKKIDAALKRRGY